LVRCKTTAILTKPEAGYSTDRVIWILGMLSKMLQRRRWRSEVSLRDQYHCNMSKSRFIKIILCFVFVLAVVGVGWKIMMPDDSVTVALGAGKKLTGTDDITDNFSVSPDGEWIVYSSKHGTPFKPLYVLYNVKKQERHEIGLSPRAKEISAGGLGPLGVGCWSSDGTQVFLPTGLKALVMADVRAGELQWVVLEDVEQSKWRYYFYECPKLSDATSAVHVIQRSPSEAEIVDIRTGRILATYRTQNILQTDIDIEYIIISPDGKHIAYLVDEHTLGWGVTPYRGYILDIWSGGAAEPEFLATGVLGPIRWEPDGNTVYAAVGYGDDTSIYVWKLNVEH
jgi:hypothetical protein